MSTLYHVCESWDGGDLLPALVRVQLDDSTSYVEVCEAFAIKWPDADRYLETVEARQVHFHASLAEAVDYRDEWCPEGVILAVEGGDEGLDGHGIRVRVGHEYPHPVVEGRVPAELVTIVEACPCPA